MRTNFILFLAVLYATVSFSQSKNEAQLFWESLQSLCGQSFEGSLELPEDDDQFSGKRLVMHVRSCSDTTIKIPFFVGNDKSRTWVLTKADGRITLKHDHRHEDGSEDKITQYGGTTTNLGQDGLQIFPADGWTREMIPAASSNVWWITVDESTFSYNLRRLGTPRVFRVVFDLKNPVANPKAPWGWKAN